MISPFRQFVKTVYFRITSHGCRNPRLGRIGSEHMHVGFLIPTPTPHPTFTSTSTMQQPSASTTPRLTPKQIRRRVNDLDDQVRQALEDGTIRQVMKKIRPTFVSRVVFFFCLSSSHLPLSGPPAGLSEGFARGKGCVSMHPFPL